MINRAKMPRQMYGLGSLVKDRIRKLIPNELASVAVKAAPIVAPFNPAVAGLMRGIGRFDQRGSISDALKQGAATFGFGVGARKLGGAENVFGDFSLSSPLDPQKTQQFTSLFDKQAADPTITPKDLPGGPDASKFGTGIKETLKKAIKALPKGIEGQLIAGGLTAGASLLASYFQGEFEEPEPGESMEEYLARRREYVGTQMRTYMDNYFANDPEYSKLDDAGRDAFVARYNIRDGGRVGYQTGDLVDPRMKRSLAQNVEELVTKPRAAFRQAINPSQQKVLQRLQANQPKSSPLETFAKHAMVSEAMKGKTGMNVIPEYALQTGADFQKKFSNLNPKVSAGLAAAYQTLQEGSRAILDGPGGVTLKDAYDTALDQTTKNIEGILAADSGNLTAKQIEDRNKYLKQQGQPTEEIPGAISQEGIIPGFKRIGERSYQGPDGQIYGPETYASIAAGMYPNIYDPNKKVIPAEPPRKIIPEEGTIGPITKLPVEPDPDTPIDELVKPIMPTLPVEPRTDQQILEGFAKFKEQNPGIGAGPGLQVMIYGRLPDGTPLTFGNSAQANAFNQYLESIGQPPFERVSGDIRKITDNEEKSLSKLATGGMPVGIMRTNKAGVMERDYRDKGGFVPVGIKEKADDVPAMLSKNEFVFTADAVRGAGNGSIEKGAQKMYDTMKKLEKRVV